jgi:hypothetical protein
MPSLINDIHTLAFELACNLIKLYKGDRVARYQVLDIHMIRLERVVTKKLEVFNTKVIRDEN